MGFQQGPLDSWLLCGCCAIFVFYFTFAFRLSSWSHRLMAEANLLMWVFLCRCVGKIISCTTYYTQLCNSLKEKQPMQRFPMNWFSAESILTPSVSFHLFFFFGLFLKNVLSFILSLKIIECLNPQNSNAKFIRSTGCNSQSWSWNAVLLLKERNA